MDSTRKSLQGVLGTPELSTVVVFGHVGKDAEYGTFRKLGVPYFAVPVIGILLFKVPYYGPLFSVTPI